MFSLNLNTSQPAQTSNPFGITTHTPQPPPSLFGQTQRQGGGLFGGLPPSQPQSGLFGVLGQNTQQQSRSLSGNTTQSAQQNSLLGGGPFSGFGQSAQQQPQQQLQFGRSQQDLPLLQLGESNRQNPLAQIASVPPLWEEGRGVGVFRTIPAQMTIVKEKWDPSSLVSPLRTYLYQVEDEQNVPYYQPGIGEDEHKWEEAVSKRPGPNYVPVLARGFWDLGKRAQRQREFIEKCNIRLHDINSSLDAQLELHSQRIANKIAECRQRHNIASQRTLVLAAKIQILRNRGYVMDNAEEELKAKLAKMEKEVLDPTSYGREQEIWARMLGIRERSKQLKTELEKVTPASGNGTSSLDEETIRIAKKALEAYDTQLRHLQNELQLVVGEYEDWEKASTIDSDGSVSRR